MALHEIRILHNYSAGTAGPAVAARLAEDASITVLLIEAGPDNLDLDNTHMVGGWSQNFDTEHDWNLVSEPNKAAENRVVKLSRGKFLGGSSAVNGTLMVRGAKQDYDDVSAIVIFLCPLHSSCILQ